jgi:hypothetical protein
MFVTIKIFADHFKQKMSTPDLVVTDVNFLPTYIMCCIQTYSSHQIQYSNNVHRPLCIIWQNFVSTLCHGLTMAPEVYPTRNQLCKINQLLTDTSNVLIQWSGHNGMLQLQLFWVISSYGFNHCSILGGRAKALVVSRPASHCGGSGSIPGQSMWDLWCIQGCW